MKGGWEIYRNGYVTVMAPSILDVEQRVAAKAEEAGRCPAGVAPVAMQDPVLEQLRQEVEEADLAVWAAQQRLIDYRFAALESGIQEFLLELSTKRAEALAVAFAVCLVSQGASRSEAVTASGADAALLDQMLVRSS